LNDFVAVFVPNADVNGLPHEGVYGGVVVIGWRIDRIKRHFPEVSTNQGPFAGGISSIFVDVIAKNTVVATVNWRESEVAA
jgi:hypothetical protein